MELSKNISLIEIQDVLVRRLGEKEAAEIISGIQTEIEREVRERAASSAPEILNWRDEMKDIFSTKEEAASLEKKLIQRVSRAEGTLIIWSFVFWLTLLISLIVIFKLFK